MFDTLQEALIKFEHEALFISTIRGSEWPALNAKRSVFHEFLLGDAWPFATANGTEIQLLTVMLSDLIRASFSLSSRCGTGIVTELVA
jgi:hypothetical protein